MNTRKVLVAATIAASTWGLTAGTAMAATSAPATLVDTAAGTAVGTVDGAIGTVNGITRGLPVEVPQITTVPPVAVPSGPLPSVTLPSAPALPSVPTVAVPKAPALPSVPATPALPEVPSMPSINGVLGSHGVSFTVDLTSLGLGFHTVGIPPELEGITSAPDVVTLPEADVAESLVAAGQHQLGMVVADVMTIAQEIADMVMGGIQP